MKEGQTEEGKNERGERLGEGKIKRVIVKDKTMRGEHRKKYLVLHFPLHHNLQKQEAVRNSSQPESTTNCFDIQSPSLPPCSAPTRRTRQDSQVHKTFLEGSCWEPRTGKHKHNMPIKVILFILASHFDSQGSGWMGGREVGYSKVSSLDKQEQGKKADIHTQIWWVVENILILLYILTFIKGSRGK